MVVSLSSCVQLVNTGMSNWRVGFSQPWGLAKWLLFLFPHGVAYLRLSCQWSGIVKSFGESINIAHLDLKYWRPDRLNPCCCPAERNPLVAFRFLTTWCCPTRPPCQSGFECVSRRAMRTHGTLPPSSTCPFTSWIPPPSPRSSSQYLWLPELHCTPFWVFGLKTWAWGLELGSWQMWYAEHVLKSRMRLTESWAIGVEVLMQRKLQVVVSPYCAPSI